MYDLQSLLLTILKLKYSVSEISLVLWWIQ